MFRLLPAFFALFSLACEQAAPTGTAPARASASAAPKRVATSGPSARPAGPMNAPLGIQWAAPDGWITQEPNPGDVRRATYVVPKLEGDAEDAEVGVFYFGKAMGGNLNANLQRWAGQFGKALADGKTTEKTLGEVGLTIFEIQGTFQSGRPMGPKTPKPGYAMVGVVVKTNATGNYFFKLTGPEKTVLSARAKFLSMCEGIREVPIAAK